MVTREEEVDFCTGEGEEKEDIFVVFGRGGEGVWEDGGGLLLEERIEEDERGEWMVWVRGFGGRDISWEVGGRGVGGGGESDRGRGNAELRTGGANLPLTGAKRPAVVRGRSEELMRGAADNLGRKRDRFSLFDGGAGRSGLEINSNRKEKNLTAIFWTARRREWDETEGVSERESKAGYSGVNKRDEKRKGTWTGTGALLPFSRSSMSSSPSISSNMSSMAHRPRKGK